MFIYIHAKNFTVMKNDVKGCQIELISSSQKQSRKELQGSSLKGQSERGWLD